MFVPGIRKLFDYLHYSFMYIIATISFFVIYLFQNAKTITYRESFNADQLNVKK